MATREEQDKIGDDLNEFACKIARELSPENKPLRFTGLKSGYDEATDTFDLFFVAQWCDLRYHTKDSKKQDCYFVNIPGMQHGAFHRGGKFELGDARITSETSPSAIEKMVRDGYELCIRESDKHFGKK